MSLLGRKNTRISNLISLSLASRLIEPPTPPACPAHDTPAETSWPVLTERTASQDQVADWPSRG